MQSILLGVIRNILLEYEKGSNARVEAIAQQRWDAGLEEYMGISYMDISEKLRKYKWIVNDPMNPNLSMLGEKGIQGLKKLQEGDDEELQRIAELFEIKRCMREVDIPVGEKRTSLSGKHTKQLVTRGICGKPARHVVRDGDREIYACEECVAAVRKAVSDLDDET